jgi:hypothetical protein
MKGGSASRGAGRLRLAAAVSWHMHACVRVEPATAPSIRQWALLRSLVGERR